MTRNKIQCSSCNCVSQRIGCPAVYAHVFLRSIGYNRQPRSLYLGLSVVVLRCLPCWRRERCKRCLRWLNCWLWVYRVSWWEIRNYTKKDYFWVTSELIDLHKVQKYLISSAQLKSSTRTGSSLWPALDVGQPSPQIFAARRYVSARPMPSCGVLSVCHIRVLCPNS